METRQSPIQRSCVVCNRPLDNDANVCPRCGHDYRPGMSGHGWESVGTPLAPIGGALIAYAGFTQAISGLMWVFAGDFDLTLSTSESVVLTAVLGLVAIAVGTIAIAGGAFAITRRRLALALIGGAASVAAGGVLSVYSIGVIAGTTIGLIGVLLVGIARNEFLD